MAFFCRISQSKLKSFLDQFKRHYFQISHSAALDSRRTTHNVYGYVERIPRRPADFADKFRFYAAPVQVPIIILMDELVGTWFFEFELNYMEAWVGVFLFFLFLFLWFQILFSLLKIHALNLLKLQIRIGNQLRFQLFFNYLFLMSDWFSVKKGIINELSSN